MDGRCAPTRPGPAGDPDHRAWRYFDGRARDAKWCLRLHRETMFLGAARLGGTQGGRKETPDPGSALVAIRLGRPRGNRGELAGPVAADPGSAKARIHT